MGRQHTTWIDDETWDRLERIAGDSISDKLRNAVKFADPHEMTMIRLRERNRDELRVLIDIIYTTCNDVNDDDISDLREWIIELLNENISMWYVPGVKE
jgi:hypothetical protein